MSALFVIFPLALLLAGVAVWVFITAVRRGQFDDLETPKYRAIFDDEPARSE